MNRVERIIKALEDDPNATFEEAVDAYIAASYDFFSQATDKKEHAVKATEAVEAFVERTNIEHEVEGLLGIGTAFGLDIILVKIALAIGEDTLGVERGSFEHLLDNQVVSILKEEEKLSE